MKIGIFDSGLGGLAVSSALIKALPEYDYHYLGDTKNLPYGEKTQAHIYALVEKAIRYLFEQDCLLVILACNTASAEALRKIQMCYLPGSNPDRKVLGVLIPAAEETKNYNNIGVLATPSTVDSRAYLREINKVNPDAKVVQVAATTLVPLIESGHIEEAKKEFQQYLSKMPGMDAIILGCTHYSLLPENDSQYNFISTLEILPDKLKLYLEKHPEIDSRLSRNGTRCFEVTNLSEHFSQSAKLFIQDDWQLGEVSY